MLKELIIFFMLCPLKLTLKSHFHFSIFQKGLVEQNEDDTWYYLLMFTLALCIIRCTSFSLEKCWNKHDIGSSFAVPALASCTQLLRSSTYDYLRCYIFKHFEHKTLQLNLMGHYISSKIKFNNLIMNIKALKNVTVLKSM